MVCSNCGSTNTKCSHDKTTIADSVYLVPFRQYCEDCGHIEAYHNVVKSPWDSGPSCKFCGKSKPKETERFKLKCPECGELAANCFFIGTYGAGGTSSTHGYRLECGSCNFAIESNIWMGDPQGTGMSTYSTCPYCHAGDEHHIRSEDFVA